MFDDMLTKGRLSLSKTIMSADQLMVADKNLVMNLEKHRRLVNRQSNTRKVASPAASIAKDVEVAFVI